MKKRKEYAIIFTLGGLFYSLLEILWRGYSHWTMTLTGGGCFLSVYLINTKCATLSLFRRCIRGSAVITAAELTVGCIVNILLGWKVWDYSSMKFNFLGQICLLFSFMWFLLCIPAAPLCRVLKRILSPEGSAENNGMTESSYGSEAEE